MIDLKKYWYLNGENVVVTCTDNSTITGQWTNWTSALDNEPDPESITIEKPWGEGIEIFIHEIKDIQKAS